MSLFMSCFACMFWTQCIILVYAFLVRNFKHRVVFIDTTCGSVLGLGVSAVCQVGVHIQLFINNVVWIWTNLSHCSAWNQMHVMYWLTSAQTFFVLLTMMVWCIAIDITMILLNLIVKQIHYWQNIYWMASKKDLVYILFFNGNENKLSESKFNLIFECRSVWATFWGYN